MREVNLSGVDLNLIPPLEALLRRRNVTHAAVDVGLSQPAMSRALSRLRLLLADPLLVRGHSGLVLTPLAQRLIPRVAMALSELKGVFQEPIFDPTVERRTVRIAASDTQTILLAPKIMSRLSREAPGVELRMEPYGQDLITRMEAGTLDLAFASSSTPLPVGAVSEPIANDRLVLVMRRHHPAAARSWTLADYTSFDHVTVALLGDGQSEIDAILGASGLSRRTALVTPHFMAALATVSATDMITTISEAFAWRFADTFNLVLRKPPFAETELRMTLVWSNVRTTDPMLAWFRTLVQNVAEDVYANKRRAHQKKL